MRPNPLRQKIAAGKAVVGPLLQEIPDSPELVELLGNAGFDYVVVDGEHAGVHNERARELTRAAEAAGICALARVPDANPSRILSFLDSGIQGIILAHCNSAADAEALVQAVKYPPRGVRGAASGSRAAQYGYSGAARARDLVELANRETMCLGLIEEQPGVDAVPEMLEVDGFDGCFLGAGDLSLTMGLEYYGLSPMHPEVQKRIDRVRDQTLAAGKLVMAPSGNGAGARELIDQGIQMIIVQFGQFFRAACNSYLTAARGG